MIRYAFFNQHYLKQKMHENLGFLHRVGDLWFNIFAYFVFMLCVFINNFVYFKILKKLFRFKNSFVI